MSRDLAGYARSGAWSVVAEATNLVSSIVLSVVIVRSLTTREFGVLSEVRQITALATVLAGLALERTALRFVPEFIERGGGSAAARFFWRTLGLRVLAWVPVMGAAWLLGPSLERVFNVPLAGLARIGVATALAFSLHNYVRACATARFATRTVAIAVALGNVVTLATTWWLLAAGKGVAGVLAAAGGGMFVACLLQVPPAIARDPQVKAGTAVTAVSRRRIVDFTAPFFGIAVLNFLVHSETEVLFLGHFRGPDPAGFFKLGFTFAQRLIDFLPLALWEVSMAGFSRIAVQDATRLPRAMRAYLSLLYLAIAPLVCLGVAFSPSVIRLLYGQAMAPAALVSQAYFVMAGYAALGAPIGMIVYARERVGAALRAYVVFATVNVALDLTLIPRLGLWGGILGLGSAKLLSVLLLSRIAWKEIPGLSVPWRLLGKAFAASSPVLLWLAVQQRFTAAWQVALGMAAAALLVVLGYRVLDVVGEQECELIARTRLPLQNVALLLVARPRPRKVAP